MNSGAEKSTLSLISINICSTLKKTKVQFLINVICLCTHTQTENSVSEN